MEGFKKFILRGNVIELAVAVVIGAAFGAVVTSMVKDIITPIIGVFGGIPDFSGIYFEINKSKFMIGNFINAVLAFLVLAFVVYFFVVQPYQAMMERLNPTPPPPGPTRDCPECLGKVPKKARKCQFCASALVPEA